MHNKEAPKTPSHLMRLVDLIFLHLPWYQVKWRGGVWAENEGESHVFFPYTTFLLVIVINLVLFILPSIFPYRRLIKRSKKARQLFSLTILPSRPFYLIKRADEFIQLLCVAAHRHSLLHIPRPDEVQY